MNFCKEIWKKEKISRGGLEERKFCKRRFWKKRIFPQEEVWKKEKFARAFWKEEFCKRSFGTNNFVKSSKQFCKKGLWKKIQEFCKKKSSLKERNSADQLMKLWQQAKTFHCYVVVLTLECWNGSLN